ncbi:MAG: Rrf2 family transcriptional regulator [Bifidobacteriaceae bacterium]|jgi:DNA-binding IscR family transcriptional regulator|nr:Rrf2 family transcriptional regulator [Bifidobacteriaceae bacterium]MCI1979103.1 Rrf2 family transcriptional regulator [Bifidobacteriaceae bacterium]
MKYGHKLSDAVHILVYVEMFKHGDLSSKSIAESVESNPSLIRRLMSTLAKAGLLQTTPGTVQPRLARPASEISLADVYAAIEPGERLLHVDEKTNPRCPVGGNIQGTLNSVYDRVQHDALRSMAEVSLQSMIDDVRRREQERTDRG